VFALDIKAVFHAVDRKLISFMEVETAVKNDPALAPG
jgi:hypothetical protein